MRVARWVALTTCVGLAGSGCNAPGAPVDGGSDGGRVATCAEAIAAVNEGTGTLFSRCGGGCVTNIACPDLGSCFQCPYFVRCVDGLVHLEYGGLVCFDGGPGPDAAPGDAEPAVSTCVDASDGACLDAF